MSIKAIFELFRTIKLIIGLIQSGMKQHEKQKHDDSVDQLGKAKTEDEVKDAARKYLRNS